MITPPNNIYLDVIRNVHESHIRAVLYEETAGGLVEVGTLPVTSVTMTYDGKALVHRSVDIQYGIDPWDTVSRDIIERVSTESGRVTLEHGVSQAGVEDISWVLLATLRVDTVSSGLADPYRTLYAFDRSILPKEHLFETVHPFNDTYMNLIQTFLDQTIPGEPLIIDPGFDPAAIALTPADGKSATAGTERLNQMQNLADAVEGVVVNDPDGSFRLRPVLPPGAPVWSVDAGDDGVLVGGLEETSRREQYNAVSITWVPDDTDPDADWTLRIFLWDNDPASPTFYDGPFGKRPIFFDDEYAHLPTQETAEQLARQKLELYSGMSRSLSITSVYNPLLEPGDTIEIVFPDDTVENHVIDTLTVELGPVARMDIETRLDRPTVTRAYVIGSASGKRYL